MRLVVLFLLSLGTPTLSQYAALEFDIGLNADLVGGLQPRIFLADPLALRKRQDGVGCPVDYHPCTDIQHPESCCSNNQYCYVGANGSPRCCAIGIQCPDQPCPSDEYLCPETATATTTRPTSFRCCSRKCTQTSFFRCETALSDGCCRYGNICGPGGACISTTTTSLVPVVTPLDEGCTTSQHRCADGQGCCNNAFTCTSVDGSAVCSPTASTIVAAPGLSDGAKGGIGAGVAVGVTFFTAASIWIVITQRRRRRLSRSPGDSSGEPQHRKTDSHQRTPADAASDATPVGIAQDYFGPDAVHGPFTEANGAAAGNTTPLQRGVPTTPHDPNDIAAPVEIDSRVASSPLPSSSSPRFELYGSPIPSPPPSPTSSLPPSPPSIQPESSRSG